MSGRKRFAFAVLLLFLGWASGLPAQAQAARPASRTPTRSAQLRDGTFRSAALGREVRYRILLPAGYGQSQERYPALYLLHGLSGNFEDWSTRTGLVRYAQGLRLIIVMPDAGDSWYVNWDSDPVRKYGDYIAKDLLAEIDEHYRTIRAPHGRAIAGLSMGGYGAVAFALKYPQLFAFAGSFSGALTAAADLDSTHPVYREGLLKAFGPAGSATRTQNDVFTLLKKSPPANLPYFYIDCGTSDSFLSANRAFAALLQAQNAAYEYHETPGGHTWSYWDERVRSLLEVLVRRPLSQHPPRQHL
ncbi:MAG: esterase family protein [Acidobacteriia bacterium]|nr:esterase family protein [Terriglobia bacterium]